MTLEKAKIFINKKVNYLNRPLTITDVREIDNDGRSMILAYFKEINHPINIAILRDEGGKYLGDKLQELSNDEEQE